MRLTHRLFRLLHSHPNGDGRDVACESVLRDRSLVAEDPLLSAHFDLPGTRLAPRRARQLVAHTLTGPTAPEGAAELNPTAQLLVSELVTNAVMHARTKLHLGISGDTQILLFTIADGDPSPSWQIQSAATTSEIPGFDYEESGRGLAIVVGLATEYGWRRRDDGNGKILWFTLGIRTTGQ